MKKYLLSFAVLLGGCLLFSSCSDDDDNKNGKQTFVTVTNGAYVLNEGSYYSQINGSLSYIDYSSGTITNGLFQSVNGRSLGGTPNSMLLTGGEGYIACTDENRVEIVDAHLKSVASVSITQPREMTTDGESVFVTSYDGTVSQISCTSHTVVAKSEVIGACLEGIAWRDGSLYVCNAYNADYTYNTNVVKLNAATLKKEKDITVACNPTSIKASDGALYVLSSGNYGDVQAQIQKIDASDNVTYLLDGTLFDVCNGTLYVINSVTDWETYQTTTTYTRCDAAGNKTSFTPTQDIVSPCAIAVDPFTGYVFISSYVMGASGYADYSADGYVCVFDFDNDKSWKYTAGVGPCTVVFNEVSVIKE